VEEFRYVDLPEPLMLDVGKTYALTMDTGSDDGDLFHHFASHTGVTPLSTDLIGDFVARRASADGDYPGQYPDGSDGEGNRNDDMFRHRGFVGPNARIASFQVVQPVIAGQDVQLTFAAGEGITYRLEASESLVASDWEVIQTGITGRNGWITLTLEVELGARLRRFYRLVKE
jgi:hypothetical protein